eukprot:1585006-Prymnesium_polylepis.1
MELHARGLCTPGDLKTLHATLDGQVLSHDPTWYNVDEQFIGAVRTALKVKNDALGDLAAQLTDEQEHLSLAFRPMTLHE